MQENSRKTSTSASLTTRKPLTVWITTNCGKFLKRWNTRLPYLSPEKPVFRSRSNSRTSHGTTGSKLGRYEKTVNCHPAYLTYMQSAVCCAWSLSLVWLFATPSTVAQQAPLFMGILQARILEWVSMPSSRGSSQPRDWTQVSCIAGGFFTSWAAREVYMQSTSCELWGWMSNKLESRSLGEISTTPDMQTIPL